MKIFNWCDDKQIIFFFVFFLCTLELLEAETKLSNLIRKQTIDIEDFKNLLNISDDLDEIALDKIAMDNRSFKIQEISYPEKFFITHETHDFHGKYIGVYSHRIEPKKTVYTYTCPSSVDRAIKKIVAVHFIENEWIENELLPPLPVVPRRVNKETLSIVITFDGSKVKFGPEDIIKGFGLKRELLGRDGSLEIPPPPESSTKFLSLSQKCKFIANRLVELQIKKNFGKRLF